MSGTPSSSRLLLLLDAGLLFAGVDDLLPIGAVCARAARMSTGSVRESLKNNPGEGWDGTGIWGEVLLIAGWLAASERSLADHLLTTLTLLHYSLCSGHSD